MEPLHRYLKDLQRPGFHPDAAQRRAVERLDSLYRDLIAPPTPPGWLGRLRGVRPSPVRGLYLWGGVGRGKTYLMNCFYSGLPFADKRRVHYHKFMVDIHEHLKLLPKSPDPLPVVADRIADSARVLCLDEFHVHDVADAMLLSGLLRALFERGVTLVATSNTRIEQLYLNGLQRERFMTAIELLLTHTEQVDLGNGTDYRLALMAQGETYTIARNGEHYRLLEQRLRELAPGEVRRTPDLTINHRPLQALAEAEDVVWFDFNELCDTARSAHDYLEIARRYHTVLLSAVPPMGEAQENAAQRFMHLVDALYDHGVKLIVTAEAPPDALYHGKRLVQRFERTVSRLIEMSSRDYLGRPHGG
jgi:cell division protein ZapE